MVLFKTMVFILIFVVCTTFLPNLQNVLSQVLNVLRTWMPSVVYLMEEIVTGIHKYCTESLLKDIKRLIAVLTDLIGSVVHLLQPIISSYFEMVANGLITLHNNGMGYTDEFLQQVLGIDGKKHHFLVEAANFELFLTELCYHFHHHCELAVNRLTGVLFKQT